MKVTDKKWLSLLLLSGLVALACAQTPAAVSTPSLPTGCANPVVFPVVPGYVPFYADRDKGGAFSVIDPATMDAMNRAMAGFNKGQRDWLRMTNKVAADGDAATVRCAFAWLQIWAQGRHMLGAPAGSQPEQYQSRYEMKWALQGLATAYALVLRPRFEAAERAPVEAWLREAGQQVAAFNIERPGEGKLNNHYYWGGASVMAVALATDDRPLRELAWRTYRAGIDEIREDGSLPREMTRRQQALHYHNYSLTPLLMMAELARRSGEDWYAYRPERLPQLVALILHALADPVFAQTFFGIEHPGKYPEPCMLDTDHYP